MKRKILIPLVIVLTLIVGVFAVGVMAADSDPELTITGGNLKFAERVYMLFAVDSENISDTENVRLLVFRGENVKADKCVVGNQVATIAPGSPVVDENVSGDVFTYTDIAAAEMTEDIYVRAYYKDADGNEYYSNVIKYSILQYAMNKLGYTGTPAKEENVRKMLSKMLEYGAAAQDVFGVNTDRLATDEYVKVYLNGAEFEDGLNYGLVKKNATARVYAPDSANPFVVIKDNNGNIVSRGEGYADVPTLVNATYTVEFLAEEPSFGAYDRVVIVGIDGAGSFYENYVNENSKRIQNKIFGNGAVTRTMRVGTPTASCVGWGALLHGVTPENLGYVENYVVEEAETFPLDSKYPSILKLTKDAYPESDVAALYSWIGIQGTVEQNYGIDTLHCNNNVDLTNYITDTYLANNDPKMLYVHLGNPDYIGHTVGHHTAEYYASLDLAYTQIEAIYDALDAGGLLENTLFIVTTDHGGVGLGHGGLTDCEKYGMFAVAGKTVENGKIGEMELRDGASIALYALGIQQPETYTSAIPANVFKGVLATERHEYHDVDNPRYHEPETTPASGSEDYIANYFDNLTTYIPFDGTTSTAIGSTVDEFGKIVYEDGYFGKGVKLDDGHLNVNEFAPGEESFTIALWMKTPSAHVSSPIIMNKEWDTSENGLHVALERDTSKPRGQESYIRYGFGNNASTVSVSKDVSLPENFYSGWFHLIISVDRENREVTLVYDFGEAHTLKISSIYDANIDKTNLTTIYNYLTLGNDATGEAEYKSGFSVDEFMIFDGAFDRADINKLAEYFGVNENSLIEEEKNVTNVFDEGMKPDVYFDFNDNIKNKGEGAYRINEIGTVPFVEGVNGSAVYLDGKNYISMEDFNLGTGSYTFSFWLNPTDMRTGETDGNGRYIVPIISNADGSSRENAGISIQLNCERDRLNLTMGDETNNGFNRGYNLPADVYENQWLHIIIVADRAASGGNVYVYVNFVELESVEQGKFTGITYYNTKTDPFTSSLDTTNPFNIGQYGNPALNSNTNRTLLANVDDLMIFKRALSLSEVVEMCKYYRGTLSDHLDVDPTIYFDFNGDIDNNGSYTGAVNGSATLTQGYYGEGATFTNDQSIDLTDYQFGDKSFTIAFWMKSDYVSGYSHTEGDENYYWLPILATRNMSGTDEGLEVFYSRDYQGIFVRFYKNGNPYYLNIKFDGIHKENEWMHVTIVVDREAGKIRGYLNFEAIEPTGWDYDKIANVPADTPTGTLHIGQDGQGDYHVSYRKQLDEFLIFDVALTEDEIAKLAEYYGY